MNAPETNPPFLGKILIIGYGNELRGDDGAGRKLAEEVGSWKLDEVETLSVRQLTPEIAAALCGSSCVVFIDATIATDSGSEVRVTSLVPPPENSFSQTHHCGPVEILALAAMLYGTAPAAVLLTIPGEVFGWRETLSPLAAANYTIALDTVKMLTRALKAKGANHEP